jgi:hypothetical protein
VDLGDSEEKRLSGLRIEKEDLTKELHETRWVFFFFFFLGPPQVQRSGWAHKMDPWPSVHTSIQRILRHGSTNPSLFTNVMGELWTKRHQCLTITNFKLRSTREQMPALVLITKCLISPWRRGLPSGISAHRPMRLRTILKKWKRGLALSTT